MIHPNHAPDRDYPPRRNRDYPAPELMLQTQKERQENYCSRGKHHFDAIPFSGAHLQVCFDCGAAEIRKMAEGYDWVPLGG